MILLMGGRSQKYSISLQDSFYRYWITKRPTIIGYAATYSR
jgi:hypothetical protein